MGDEMGQDTVLIGAFGFFVIGGVIWLILTRLQTSSLPERAKRLLTYSLLGLVAATAIYVIHWHSKTIKRITQKYHNWCSPPLARSSEADGLWSPKIYPGQLPWYAECELA